MDKFDGINLEVTDWKYVKAVAFENKQEEFYRSQVFCEYSDLPRLIKYLTDLYNEIKTT